MAIAADGGFNRQEVAFLANVCLAAEAAERGDPRAILAEAAADYEAILAADGAVRERTVNKAIEEGVLAHVGPGSEDLDRAAVYYLASLRRLANVTLSAEAKRRLYRALQSEPIPSDRPWALEIDPHLFFAPGDVLDVWRRLIDTYEDDRGAYVECDAARMGGRPVVRGTRIPVYSVLGRIDGGDTLEDLCEDYPDVPRAAFATALAYARTHPKRGRPEKRLRAAV